MPSYISDAVRRAYGIEYTGPVPVHKVKRARKKPKHHHVERAKKAKKAHVQKGHVVHVHEPTLRGTGHLVHYRRHF